MTSETVPAPEHPADYSFRPLCTIASAVARENETWLAIARSWGEPLHLPPPPVIIPDEQRAEWDRLTGGHAGVWPLPQRIPAGRDRDPDGMPAGWGELNEELSRLPGADDPMPGRSKSGTIPPPVQEVMPDGSDRDAQGRTRQLENVPRPVDDGLLTQAREPSLPGTGQVTAVGPGHPDAHSPAQDVPRPGGDPPAAGPGHPIDDEDRQRAADEAAAAVQAETAKGLLRIKGVDADDLAWIGREGDGTKPQPVPPHDATTEMTAILPVAPEREHQQ